jgi:PAS domain S-box-containing protein
LKRVLKTGEPALNIEIAGETSGDPGNTHWWFASFVPMERGNGKPHGLGAMVIDITAQKRLESALSESEARYRLLAEETSDAVILFDEQGNIEDVNRRASEVFLYSRDEITSLNVRDLIPTEDLALAPIRFDDLLAGKTVRRKRRLLRKNGSLVQVEIIGQMVGRGRMQSVMRVLSDQEALMAISNNGRSSGLPGEKPYSVSNVTLLRELSSALSNAAQIIEMASSQEMLPAPGIEQGIDFYEEVSRFEVEILKRALKHTGGKQKQAASLLGIKQTTLHAMIKRYNIDLSEFES